MSEIHSGGCHCGGLRYQFDAPLRDIAHCHCSICRRTSGATVVTWISVPLASFTWLTGSPCAYDSAPSCVRYFCCKCGAHLALFTRNSPDEIDVTIATLDQSELAAPSRHIWIENRLPWLRLDEHLPGVEGEPF
ncbi:GFA family protein [Pseudomonas syringae]|uniref:GFA family protein n=1 Tax=Pseudomonas syringae TaxID=317 RepID=UPI001F35EBA7|nr:GFA family protein [Pseudomonas syringae]MCF9001737.1 GFA family protein [Pseudomonas syringae]